MKIFNQKDDELNFNFTYNNDETKNIKSDIENIKSKGDLIDMCDLRRIALRKLNRVMNVSDDILESLTGLLDQKNIDIEASDIKKIIINLSMCEGVGFPMLSTILKFIRPDVFPIIDVRAYRALYGKKIYNYDIEIYIDYVKKIYEIADYGSLILEEVYQQLYEFDKKYNGKI